MTPLQTRWVVTAFLTFGLAVTLANLLYAGRNRRIVWGRVFTKLLWAERSQQPFLYWGMVVLQLVVAGGFMVMLLADPNSLLAR